MATQAVEKSNELKSKTFKVLSGVDPMECLRDYLSESLKNVLLFAEEGNLASEWDGEYFGGSNPYFRVTFLGDETVQSYWSEIFEVLVEKVDPLVEEYLRRLEEIEKEHEGNEVTLSYVRARQEAAGDLREKLEAIKEEVEKEFLAEENFQELVFDEEVIFCPERNSIFITGPETRLGVAYELEKTLEEDQEPSICDAEELVLDIPDGESLPSEKDVWQVVVFREGDDLLVKFVFCRNV